MRGPVYWWGYIACTDGVGNSQARFFEGVNASGRRMFDSRSISTENQAVMFPVPVYLERGLFVDFLFNQQEVFILIQNLDPTLADVAAEESAEGAPE
jgi:hypothetical protein